MRAQHREVFHVELIWSHLLGDATLRTLSMVPCVRSSHSGDEASTLCSALCELQGLLQLIPLHPGSCPHPVAHTLIPSIFRGLLWQSSYLIGSFSALICCSNSTCVCCLKPHPLPQDQKDTPELCLCLHALSIRKLGCSQGILNLCFFPQ